MKSISLFLLYFGLTGIIALAQPKSITKSLKINWESNLKTPNADGGISEILTCTECSEKSGNSRIPVLKLSFPKQSLSGIKITNEKWAYLMPWEAKGVDTANLQFYSPFEVSVGEIQRQNTTNLSINLIRKNLQNQQWEKLISADFSAVAKPLTVSPKRIAAAETTVFAMGEWVKIGIVKSGVYSVTGNELFAAGLNLIATNPNQIKVYGTGGKLLSEANNSFNFQDIPELTIQVTGTSDGKFDPTDQVLFYAEDAHKWLYNATNKAFEFQTNIYSDTSYYFITTSPGEGKRVNSAPSEPAGDVNLTYFEERNVQWEDKINVLSTGREWYGTALDFTTSKTYSFPSQGLLWDSLQKIRIGVMARSQTSYPFKISVNDVQLANQIKPGAVDISAQYGSYGTDAIGFFKQQLNPGSDPNIQRITVFYDKAGDQSAVGYTNYVETNYLKQLQWNSEGFGFRNFSQKGRSVNYSISNLPGDFSVWDITKPLNPIRREVQLGSFSVFLDTLKEFYVFSNSTARAPALLKKIGNQNLRGTSAPDLLIVAHPSVLSEANRLAEYRRTHDHMDVAVVNIIDVYNEFSSGSQDITAIRNLAMHMYYKGEVPKLKYLLLFGDCSFDYKKRIANNTNLIPTYQGPSHLYILNSYASDDYFGILNKNKGGWSTSDLIDIGVGRLPAKSELEARQMVDKLLFYNTNASTFGKWRNTFTFVADDGDYCTHSDQADRHAMNVNTSYPPSTLKKIYLGAYEQVANAGGFTSSGATNDLLNTINSGSLTINYTGHGGETGWCDENLFNSDMINQLENKKNLSFFVTATCDFGRHDLPAQVSGAESLILNPEGGAIGVMTTGRPVNSGSNDAINRAFYQNLFSLDNEGKHITMGELQRRTKNSDPSKSSNRGFTLLGDPSATLAFPDQEAVITNFMGDSIIQGLELFAFQGEVRKGGTINSGFNGSLNSTVFDRPGIISVNDNELGLYHCRADYQYQKNVLYNGTVAVTDGKFSVQFFVPKDISYQVGNGKISLYAKSTDLQDANGAKLNLSVGGTSSTPMKDEIGPDITLFMNDRSFVDEGLVGTDAILKAYFEDSSGINVSGLGLGHDLTATLDEQEVFVLNNYFQNDIGSFKKGNLEFPIRGLSVGTHSLIVKAWDNFNNSSSKEIRFVVGVNEINNLIVKEVKLFPNPFSDGVYLSLENAYAGKSVHISLDIKDMLGRSVATKDWTYNNSTARPGAFYELAWDGKKIDGTSLPAGSYFCTIGLKSDTDGAEFKINKKLILVH